MKTFMAFILLLSFGSVFAEDHVSTAGTICADRASGKTASLEADDQSSEESVSSSEADTIEN